MKESKVEAQRNIYKYNSINSFITNLITCRTEKTLQESKIVKLLLTLSIAYKVRKDNFKPKKG